MLTLAWEPLQRLLDDGVEDMLVTHWQEVGVDHALIPLDPDWPRAFALQEQGVLHTAALRRDGKLVGYNAFHVHAHIHYRSTSFAVNDVIFVDPHERGTAGIKLIRGVEPMLRALGVVKLLYHTKMHVKVGHSAGTVGDILSRLGYRLDEKIYSLLL